MRTVGTIAPEQDVCIDCIEFMIRIHIYKYCEMDPIDREGNGWEVLVGSGWETSYLDVGIVLETCL